jgi:hypothetical protein
MVGGITYDALGLLGQAITDADRGLVFDAGHGDGLIHRISEFPRRPLLGIS